MNINNEEIATDKVIDVRQKEVKKDLKFLGSIRPHRGHTVFEINLLTSEIVAATFEELVYDYEGHKPKKKIIKKENCIYIPALNVKNAYKVLNRMINTK